ncbi:30S ribosomal protein S17 [Candidatus Woesearchaeota archaeon]|nr:30S ribosomal protein S17 [Candidatus Woesearchaeota archaeon]
MKAKKTKNIGIKAKAPRRKCNDKNCPFHGTLGVRGRSFTGTIIAKDIHKTVTVEWPRKYFIPKYERHETRRTRIRVHNPECINAEIGDKVKIMETRPLSKTKHFVIIENLGAQYGFKEKLEELEEAKTKPKEKKKEEPTDEEKKTEETDK